ncbi:hypothetical protein AgCh_029090 [Apium graveolens]
MRVVDINGRNKKKNLVDKARPILACERKFKMVVNPKLLDQKYCPKGVQSILSDAPALALKCLDLDPLKRPSMRLVVEGTLSDHLHQSFVKGYDTLPWTHRLRICIGAAQGLDYLHTGMPIRGTFGYMDPAYFSTGRLTRKSDVYAFGVVLFEVVSGRRAVDLSWDEEHLVSEGFLSPEYKEAGRLSSKNDVYAFGVVLLEILTGMRVIDVNARNEKRNLVDKARPVLENERKVRRVVNPKLLERENCPKVIKSILSDVPALALKCLDLDPKKRPSMRQVVETLERVNAIIQ